MGISYCEIIFHYYYTARDGICKEGDACRWYTKRFRVETLFSGQKSRGFFVNRQRFGQLARQRMASISVIDDNISDAHQPIRQKDTEFLWIVIKGILVIAAVADEPVTLKGNPDLMFVFGPGSLKPYPARSYAHTRVSCAIVELISV